MKYLYIIMLNVVYNISVAQTITFNRQYSLGFTSLTFQGIYATDSCYYAIGVMGDTIPPYYPTGSVFAKLDLQGNVILAKKISSDFRTYELWVNRLDLTPDNNFVAAGRSATLFGDVSFVVKFTLGGDTLWVRDFFNISRQGGFISYGDVKSLPDGNILLGTSIVNYTPTDSTMEALMLKLDNNGNILWQRLLGQGNTDDLLPNIFVENDNKYVVGYTKSGKTSNNENYSQGIFQQLDSAGNVQLLGGNFPIGYSTKVPRTARADSLVLGVNDIKPTKDGGYVITSALGMYDFVVQRALWEPFIYKTNSNMQCLWSRRLPCIGANEYSQSKRIFELVDSSLVVVGTNPMYASSGNGNQIYGTFIMKLSKDGDSIWYRAYDKINDNVLDLNFIWDAKQTPDGGFILCGETRGRFAVPNNPAYNPTQQGWLLKLDSMGCLVPGCDTLRIGVQKIANDAKEGRFKIYPNPSYLGTVTIDYELPQQFIEATISIVSLEGITVQQQNIQTNIGTIKFNVSELAAGMYFAKLVINGQLFEIQKLVLMK